jgi:hypothetical protein
LARRRRRRRRRRKEEEDDDEGKGRDAEKIGEDTREIYELARSGC